MWMLFADSGGRTSCFFWRCPSNRQSGLSQRSPVEDPGIETWIPLHWWPGLSKKSLCSFDGCLCVGLNVADVVKGCVWCCLFSCMAGFSWPAEAMGSCWSCLYRDPIRDNHLTKFKVEDHTITFNQSHFFSCFTMFPSSMFWLPLLFFSDLGHQCRRWGQRAWLWDHGAHTDWAHSSHTQERRHQVAVSLPATLWLRLQPVFFWERAPLSDWAGWASMFLFLSCTAAPARYYQLLNMWETTA